MNEWTVWVRSLVHLAQCCVVWMAAAFTLSQYLLGPFSMQMHGPGFGGLCLLSIRSVSEPYSFPQTQCLWWTKPLQTCRMEFQLAYWGAPSKTCHRTVYSYINEKYTFQKEESHGPKGVKQAEEFVQNHLEPYVFPTCSVKLIILMSKKTYFKCCNQSEGNKIWNPLNPAS